MDFSIDDISQITSEIWGSTLGLEALPVAQPPPDKANERSLIGCIQIMGDWEGAVTLYCSEGLANKATAAMFDMPLEDITDEELHDTLGELTNMTAGNIKTLLPGECRISLPSVAEGIDYKVSIPGGKVTFQHAFECDGEPLLITILERA